MNGTRIIAAVGVLLFSGALPGAASSPAATPDWLGEVRKNGHPGSFPVIRPCRLTYDFGWSNVVRAGRAVITVGPDAKWPGQLTAVAKGGSMGLARALWPYDHVFTSVVDPKSLNSVVFSSMEIDKKETLWTTNIYRPSGVEITEIVQPKKSGERQTATALYPYPECRDLMAAFLYARSLPLVDGDEIVVLSNPFGSAYLGKFTVLGREKRKTPNGEVDTIKVDIAVSKVQQDMTLKQYTKLKRATGWISDDKDRLPLELRAEIFVGAVTVKLVQSEFITPGAARAATSGAATGGAPVEKAKDEEPGGLSKWFGGGVKRIRKSPWKKR